MGKVDVRSIVSDVVVVVEEKNREYGSAFQKVSHILSILFPNGIPTNKYHDAAILIRVLDKICRIVSANDKDVKKDAWLDICGYGLLRLSEGDLNGVEDEGV
ncbi:MAG: hypothetical protein EJNHJLOP_00049 [Methanophagales virus PBV082]|uniref:Uncharacterized protein n=1 Tax=Methanophagales virus PBV082 TaxID=3071307 RepID=A0AA46YIT1_9VIRU|nr:MAG: hypothetical protein QIT52_gp49 [Methanophagales virus PBV082]UYL64938.1 MAG: hypothetical protein EJNHJLOP_00049 [Methanophagales virus PBV082]